MCYRMELLDLAEKIEKIEEEDENYQKNKKWIKYRRQQEGLWARIRRENEMQDERNFWKNPFLGNSRLSKKLARLFKSSTKRI